MLAPLAALVLVAACAANPVDVIQPVSATVQQGSQVADVEVRMSPLAEEAIVKFEEKAAEKRAEAGLPPVDPSVEPVSRPASDQYATLPFARMFELVVQDVTRGWGLDSGRPLKLMVEIDTLKTANAAMAWLAGSSDQLAGTVQVLDAGTGEKLGEFYVDVINSHSGLLGLAMRGSGIREELAEEFAIHVSRQLTGREDKAP